MPCVTSFEGGWAPRCCKSHIQVGYGAGVVLDEGSARLDLVAHEHREGAVGGGGGLERDLRERARGGVHGGVSELLGVHLAEALEALELGALLGDAEHRGAQGLEEVSGGASVA